jgi:microcystin-dependent protein
LEPFTIGLWVGNNVTPGTTDASHDAIEALQTKVGVDSSAVTTSHDYKIRIYNPIGEITMWATSTAPTGWLIADGSAISRSTYSALFGVLSTTYGVGDGSTTFNLPNLKGRVPVGRDASQTEFDTLGETGGSKTSALVVANLPAHTHTVDSNTLDVLYNAGSYTTGYITGRDADNNGVIDGTSNTFGIAVGTATDHTHTIATSGGNGTATGDTFSNLSPYIALNYIIRF